MLQSKWPPSANTNGTIRKISTSGERGPEKYPTTSGLRTLPPEWRRRHARAGAGAGAAAVTSRRGSRSGLGRVSNPHVARAARGLVRLARTPARAVQIAMDVLELIDQALRVRATRSVGVCC